MTSVNTATQVDEGKLNAFIGQMLNDLGGASSIAMVRMGDALGLYKELHTKGPMISGRASSSAKVDPRYLRERPSNQASSNYLSYDPASAKFTLTPEQAMVFAVPRARLPDGRLRSDGGAARQPTQGSGCIQVRWRRCPGRSGRLHVLRGGSSSGPAITTTSYPHGFPPCPAAC